MKIAAEIQARLAFLVRVIEKEIEHLDYADQQVFSSSFNRASIENLAHTPEYALKIEAFSSRFGRLQDTLGDKLLPALLTALGEFPKALLVNLDKAEKYGWLTSAEQWIALRQLRNRMIHEYIDDPDIFYSALVAAHNNLSLIKDFAGYLNKQVAELLSEES
ncbi:hypothetical protein [Methylotuvimicrobium sp. KM1]|uniref:hypothetical protein n=1 Tax=Methylotuvimicrobium sp. KM1 TaxID=3377707 RepID=UPI00384E1031